MALKKRRREQYSKKVCGVKPTLEQERQIQQIESDDGVTRSAIMRVALDDYLLRKRLSRVGKDVRKDPVRLLHEIILKEQIEPLRREIATLTEALKALTDRSPQIEEPGATRPLFGSADTPIQSESHSHLFAISVKLETVYKLLDQVYICSLIVQKLTTGFLLDPLIRASQQQDAESCPEIIERVRRGDQGLNQMTVQAVKLVKEQVGILSSYVIDDIEKETGVRALQRRSQPATEELSAEEVIAAT